MTAGGREPTQVAPIRDGDLLVLDTSVLIAYLAGQEVTSPVAGLIIDDLVRSERNPAVISAVSVAELMVRPLRELPALPAALRTFCSVFPA